MLTLSQNLPPGVLIGAEADSLGAQIAATGGLWFHADPDHVLMDDAGILGWRAMGAGPEVVALPTAPNQGGSRFDLDRAGFVFQTGVHCGFTLAQAAPRIDRFTAALIFTSPDEDARSLFALNTGATNMMIFLSQADGVIFAKDRAGAIEVSLPAPPHKDHRRLVILSYAQQRLTLWVDGAEASATGQPEGLDAPADLFIGCRSNRPGLVKTLGASLIHDVMFWPDRAVLGSNGSDDLAILALMRRFHRWRQA